MTLLCGDYVVVPTKYGRDLARVLGPVSPENRSFWGEPSNVHRLAVDEDLERYERNEGKAQDALRVCREKIEHHRLPMSLVSAHYVLDEPRLVFFFTAESRVDFRELVKDLVAEFHLRIELRQIGVRDEARLIGGLGVCGRVLCCHGITDKLKPVSIKMAKVQNLSLNSMKISGPCGRLLCCLEYEFDFYREEKRGLPHEGSRVKHDGTLFRVTEVNVLKQRIRLEGDGRVLEFPPDRIVHDSGSQKWVVREPEPESETAIEIEPETGTEPEST
jgi:cell fate regulator YaaT (PSP1 superfamily)